ncbi:hypothetical protein TPR58_22370 [Sphingomonas sp. HF-S3]|uniref:RNA polymerase sigma-70 region 4 domain-containing protein n=1 Tax=Sphingomonas rustica TaxID=3103142 RepID=A0ABV0BIL9_9SPHN
MTSAIDRAAELLFGNAERVLVNVRFLCGGEPNLSAEHLAEQIVLSETQIRAGRAREIVNVDEYLTSLSA